jgi:hypothetical protein
MSNRNTEVNPDRPIDGVDAFNAFNESSRRAILEI